MIKLTEAIVNKNYTIAEELMENEMSQKIEKRLHEQKKIIASKIDHIVNSNLGRTRLEREKAQIKASKEKKRIQKRTWGIEDATNRLLEGRTLYRKSLGGPSHGGYSAIKDLNRKNYEKTQSNNEPEKNDFNADDYLNKMNIKPKYRLKKKVINMKNLQEVSAKLVGRYLRNAIPKERELGFESGRANTPVEYNIRMYKKKNKVKDSINLALNKLTHDAKIPATLKEEPLGGRKLKTEFEPHELPKDSVFDTYRKYGAVDAIRQVMGKEPSDVAELKRKNAEVAGSQPLKEENKKKKIIFKKGARAGKIGEGMSNSVANAIKAPDKQCKIPMKEENLQELSKGVLASYIRKAHISGLKAAAGAENAYTKNIATGNTFKYDKILRKHNKTGEKREQGINLATKKLIKNKLDEAYPRVYGPNRELAMKRWKADIEKQKAARKTPSEMKTISDYNNNANKLKRPNKAKEEK